MKNIFIIMLLLFSISSFSQQRIVISGGSVGVTNVATGYGLTGGPITGVGTILFDSTTVFPQLRNTLPAAGNTIYTGDGTLAGNRAIALNGNTLNINQGVEIYFRLDPVIFESELRAINPIGDNNIARFQATAGDALSVFNFQASFDNESTEATIQGSADASTSALEYTADTHTFAGSVTVSDVGGSGNVLVGADNAGLLSEKILAKDFQIQNDSLKSLNWVNVLDFGADPTGVSNSTPSFQTAVATGKPVYVPAGTFLLATSVILNVGQTLFSDTWDAIIKITANTRAIVLDSNSRVTGLKFLGNGKAGSGTFNTGVFATAAVGWSVDHCMFQDFSGDATQNGGGGVYVAVLGSSNTDGGRVSNNYFYNNDCGIGFGSRGEYVTVTGNNFGANTVAILMGAGNLTITGNTVQNNTIGIKAITGTNVAHNTISSNLVNHNTYPYWVEDVTHSLGLTFNNNQVFFGIIALINSNNLKFSGEQWSSLDSIRIDNSYYLTRTGCWVGLTSGSAIIPVSLLNGAENFSVVGETRSAAANVSTWINQVHNDTNRFKGPTYIDNILNIGTAGSTTGIFTQAGVTSGVITFQPASAAGTYTLTWPTDDGGASQFLQTNGSGVLTWATPAGSGDVSKVGTPANDQLGVWTGDGTIEGPTTLTFAAGALTIGLAGTTTGQLKLAGSTSTQVTIQSLAAAGNYTLTLPPNDGGVNEFLQTDGSGVLTWAAGGSGNVSNTGTPVNNQIAVWTDATTIEGPSTLTWSGTQLAVVGAATSTAGIDLFNGAYGSILLGGDLNASTRTNVTNKSGGIAIAHYTNAEEPIMLLRGAITSSANLIAYGAGVNPGYNSATQHSFYTAANNTTLAGTIRFDISSTFAYFNTINLGIGVTSPDRLLHSETSDATTNIIVYPFRISHVTSGTAAIGGGVGMEMETENASNTMRVTGSITNPMTDATDATEDADYVFNLIDGGTLTESFRLDSDGKPIYRSTVTAAGTTGAQTINKASGTVNFATAESTLVVTNSLVTTSSIVFAVVRTNDATAVIKSVVPTAGSFTITLNAAATGETSVGFFVIN